MAHRTSTITKAYRVKDELEVQVTNVVGQEQTGSWSMSIDGQSLASGSGEQTVKIGIGGDIVFRELRVYFVIQDHHVQHDRMTATTIVACGDEKLEITHDEPGESGDSATFTTLIQFV